MDDPNKQYMSELASNKYRKTQKTLVKSNLKKGGKRTQRRKKLVMKLRKVR